MADPNKSSDLKVIQDKLNQYGKLVQGNPSADGPFWRLEKLGNSMGQIQRGIDGKLFSFEREELPGFTQEVKNKLTPTLKQALTDLEEIVQIYNKLPKKEQEQVYQQVYRGVEQTKIRHDQALRLKKGSSELANIEVPALPDAVKGFHTTQDDIRTKDGTGKRSSVENRNEVATLTRGDVYAQESSARQDTTLAAAALSNSKGFYGDRLWETGAKNGVTIG
jgi:hypothetical protein